MPEEAIQATSAAFQTIPIVDVSTRSGVDADRKVLGDQLSNILHDVGFVIITHHGVPSDLIQQIFAQSSSLLKLPKIEKELIEKKKSRHFRGWEPVGAESTNGKSDWREQIDLWTEHEAKSPGAEPKYDRLLGPNQWPSQSTAPEFRPVLNQWFGAMEELGDSLMGLFALGLGVEESRFANLFGEDRMSLVKLIRYPETPKGNFGVHAHHDTGFLTILAAGVTPGLEVQNSEGQWIDVPVIPSSFVVNIGEALQSMTGNYFVATPHRVRATAARHSCGYFHGPSLDTPLVTLTDLPAAIHDAVRASPYHSKAGFMTQTGTNDEDGRYEDYNPAEKPKTWGELVWNYLARSYPAIMAKHYPEDDG